MSTRRRQCRVRPMPDDALQVELVLPGKRARPARVLDLCCGGMRLHFPEVAAPQVVPGATVYLHIHRPGSSDPLAVACRVRHAEGATDGRVLGVEIIDWLGLLARLPDDLKNFFNKRRSLRVSPRRPKKVEVHLEGVSLSMWGHLRDVSETGLSFQVPSNMESALTAARRVRVSLRLFRSRTVSFTGAVIHRSLGEDGLSCGILFDPGRTEDFERSQALLVKYLARLRRRRQPAG